MLLLYKHWSLLTRFFLFSLSRFTISSDVCFVFSLVQFSPFLWSRRCAKEAWLEAEGEWRSEMENRPDKKPTAGLQRKQMACTCSTDRGSNRRRYVASVLIYSIYNPTEWRGQSLGFGWPLDPNSVRERTGTSRDWWMAATNRDIQQGTRVCRTTLETPLGTRLA